MVAKLQSGDLCCAFKLIDEAAVASNTCFLKPELPPHSLPYYLSFQFQAPLPPNWKEKVGGWVVEGSGTLLRENTHMHWIDYFFKWEDDLHVEKLGLPSANAWHSQVVAYMF